MTMKEDILKGLEMVGYEPVKSTSTKYVVLENNRPHREHLRRVYVGKKGALRAGDNLKWSIPINIYRNYVINKGKANKT